MTGAPLVRIAATLDPASDPGLILVQATAIAESGCEERVGAAGEPELVFWLPAARADAAAAALGRVAGVAGVACAPAGERWRDALREFHRPIRVADRLMVRPPWTEPEPGLGDVVIDPGMAFGTGQHATTKGCLELLCGVEPGSLADIGCGSGVLAIAARRLGFDPVAAVDFDPLCVDATLANARVNGVALTVARRDITSDPLPDADVVAANLTSGLLATLAVRLAGRPPRAAVLSGLRPAEAGAVAAAWEPLGLRVRDRRDADDWSALLVAP